jgi:hypothetical protein
MLALEFLEVRFKKRYQTYYFAWPESWRLIGVVITRAI